MSHPVQVPGWQPPTYRARPQQNDGPVRHAGEPNGDNWLIGLGAVAMLVAFILGVIGASQDPYYDDEYATQATIYGWGVIFGALGFWLMLFGTIIRAGKIAAGRR